MTYTVEMTDTTFEAIRAQARFIAIDRRAPENAARWLERVWDAADSLERSPRRGKRAVEDGHALYEVRQLSIGDYLLLYTIDDDSHTAVVICRRRSMKYFRVVTDAPAEWVGSANRSGREISGAESRTDGEQGSWRPQRC